MNFHLQDFVHRDKKGREVCRARQENLALRWDWHFFYAENELNINDMCFSWPMSSFSSFFFSSLRVMRDQSGQQDPPELRWVLIGGALHATQSGVSHRRHIMWLGLNLALNDWAVCRSLADGFFYCFNLDVPLAAASSFYPKWLANYCGVFYYKHSESQTKTKHPKWI